MDTNPLKHMRGFFFKFNYFVRVPNLLGFFNLKIHLIHIRLDSCEIQIKVEYVLEIKLISCYLKFLS